MDRRAVWRPRPEDPRTIFGWFVRDGAYRRLPLIAALPLVVLLGVAVVAWNPWWSLLLPFVALHVRLPRPQAAVAQIATLPAPGPAFSCNVEVRKNGVLLGEDEGVLTFVGSWLYFTGLRTEFSLSRSELTASSAESGIDLVRQTLMRRAEGERQNPRLRGSRVEVSLLGRMTVTFDPVGAWSGTDYFEDDKPLDVGFQGAFRFWAEHAPPSGRGKPVLPPNVLHPSGLARAWRDAELTFTAMFAMQLVIEVLKRWHWNLPVTGFVFIAVLPSLSRLHDAYRLRKAKRKSVAARA